MDKNQYQYPDGMDKVTEDYIDIGWCFVAVKTKIGRAAGAEPAAGQRKLNVKKPANSIFDGTVQGMGFRFKTKDLVVPMRLSAFNPGDLRNIVYLLTDGARRIRNIPEEYVVRQVSGEQLRNNVLQPLPIRIIGGTKDQIPQWRRDTLEQERDPEPKNGVAKTLFSSDLLAVSSGNLSLEMEEIEKDMLAIGEHFGLRGIEYDGDIAIAQKEKAAEINDLAIAGLDEMTLTVVDGDFPRSVIASENLTFAKYEMPRAQNNRKTYDSSVHGPGQERQGILISSVEIEFDKIERAVSENAQKQSTGFFIGFVVAMIGLMITIRTNARNR